MHPTLKQLWRDLDRLAEDRALAQVRGGLTLDLALDAGIKQYELDAEIAKGFRKDPTSGLYLPE